MLNGDASIVACTLLAVVVGSFCSSVLAVLKLCVPTQFSDSCSL